jgi:hypothetical protein
MCDYVYDFSVPLIVWAVETLPITPREILRGTLRGQVGRYIAQDADLLRHFFTNAPKRVLLFFEHFNMAGDFTYGAKALARYAFSHRDEVWGRLEWMGRHPQAPVTVAAKPHYFCELHVVRGVCVCVCVCVCAWYVGCVCVCACTMYPTTVPLVIVRTCTMYILPRYVSHRTRVHHVCYHGTVSHRTYVQYISYHGTLVVVRYVACVHVQYIPYHGTVSNTSNNNTRNNNNNKHAYAGHLDSFTNQRTLLVIHDR